MEFLIGADPELFVVNKKGIPVSAHGFLEGTKAAPMVVESGALQVDGMALEFNINPVSNSTDFYKSIKSVVEQLKMFLPVGHKFKLDPVAEFGFDYIESQPQEAKELGCTPDYNAYTGEQNPIPNASMPFRTSSGHIHIGWTSGADVTDPAHIEAAQWVAKQLDYSIGIISLFFGDASITRKRRNLYGKAGAHRVKSYGVEYRTTDSYWLRSKKHIDLTYKIVTESLRDLNDGYYYFDEHFAGISNADLQNIINTADLDAARKLIDSSPILSSYNIPKIYTGQIFR